MWSHGRAQEGGTPGAMMIYAWRRQHVYIQWQRADHALEHAGMEANTHTHEAQAHSAVAHTQRRHNTQTLQAPHTYK